MHRSTLTRKLATTTAFVLALGVIPALPAGAIGDILKVHRPKPDIDRRRGRVAPTPVQRRIARSLGDHVTWNRYGTPKTLIDYDGWLATGLSHRPKVAARAWILQNRALFRLSKKAVADLELVNVSPLVKSSARVVLFRQRFAGLKTTKDGLLILGLRRGKLAFVSSSLAPIRTDMPAPRVEVEQAMVAGLGSAGFDVSPSDLAPVDGEAGWEVFDVEGLHGPQRARLIALPTFTQGVRPAYEVLVVEIEGGLTSGYKVYVDAVTNEVWARENIVDRYIDNPRWRIFTAYPEVDYSPTDSRINACWVLEPDLNIDCQLELQGDATRYAWDEEGPELQSAPTFTTLGNAANTAQSALSPLTPSDNYRPVSPDREYIFPFTNYWYESHCAKIPNPDPNQTDINAAITNLFAMHNRAHDWSYHLGFIEKNYNMQQENFGEGGEGGDPQIGNAQAGSVTGGHPSNTGRDNANQVSTPDGVPPVTNMYLWQPLPGGVYPPCVDGDFDMTVVVHEYTHAISNRMAAGPDGGIGGSDGMGESWSDLAAVEFLAEHGYAPVGNENPFAVGAYVTGNMHQGIRNYGMDKSPLNYSNTGYNTSGPGVHADGEIWSAANFDVRKALIRKYNKDFPASKLSLQRRCARGERKPQRCPGNRRWIQMVFDAFLLLPGSVTMPQARDAYIAADKMRFKGANKKLLWNAFAKRGLGTGATGGGDIAIPSFQSPTARNGGLHFEAVDADTGRPVPGLIYVGDYEARTTPTAATAKSLGPTSARFVPGRYRFLFQAKGYGMHRFARRVRAGDTRTVLLRVAKNWASTHNGASASGDGQDHTFLIDDTETTVWAVDGREPSVKGASVTVDLAGDRRLVRSINVSTMLGPGQGSGFAAVRRFAIAVCTKTKTKKCTAAKDFRRIYRSKKNAFPAGRWRPIAPNLLLRTFNVPDRRATHVRFIVLTNHCIGAKVYRGEQDADPTYVTDCVEGSAHDLNGRATELQVFTKRPSVSFAR